VVAGTAFFVPHAGHPAKPATPGASSLARSAPERTLRPLVGISTTFRLPPEFAYERIIQEAGLLHRLDRLMQLMPALALELGVLDPFDPRENIMAGSRYLSALLAAHDGDVHLALASYNAGPGAVARYQGIPPFLETEKYVRTIVGILEVEAPQVLLAQNAMR
jgi:soluble lytic murein transglycosylase-like protein